MDRAKAAVEQLKPGRESAELTESVDGILTGEKTRGGSIAEIGSLTQEECLAGKSGENLDFSIEAAFPTMNSKGIAPSRVIRAGRRIGMVV